MLVRMSIARPIVGDIHVFLRTKLALKLSLIDSTCLLAVKAPTHVCVVDRFYSSQVIDEDMRVCKIWLGVTTSARRSS